DSFTATAGTYVLTVDATGIQDLAGNSGTGSASDTWTLNAPSSPTLQLVNENFFGGPGDENGTGVAVVNAGTDDKVYISGWSSANGDEGLVVKFNKPVGSNDVTQDWNTAWPGAAGADEFQGVAAMSTAVYAAGRSYSQTTDTVGDKEPKGVTVSFPVTGGTR